MCRLGKSQYTVEEAFCSEIEPLQCMMSGKSCPGDFIRQLCCDLLEYVTTDCIGFCGLPPSEDDAITITLMLPRASCDLG